MAKYKAFGTVFQRETDTPGQFTAVGQIRNITPSARSRDVQDVTTHDSTDGYEEVVATIRRTGEVSLELVYDPALSTHDLLLDDYHAETARTYRILFPDTDATVEEFDAWVTGLGPETPHDGDFTATVTLKPTGSMGRDESDGLTTPFFAISQSAVVTPAASQSDQIYVATVLTGVSSVTVTPTATAGTIKVNGTIVATGVASDAITLGSAGSTTEITVEVQESLKARKRYAIYVARASA